MANRGLLVETLTAKRLVPVPFDLGTDTGNFVLVSAPYSPTRESIPFSGTQESEHLPLAASVVMQQFYDTAPILGTLLSAHIDISHDQDEQKRFSRAYDDIIGEFTLQVVTILNEAERLVEGLTQQGRLERVLPTPENSITPITDRYEVAAKALMQSAEFAQEVLMYANEPGQSRTSKDFTFGDTTVEITIEEARDFESALIHAIPEVQGYQGSRENLLADAIGIADVSDETVTICQELEVRRAKAIVKNQLALAGVPADASHWLSASSSGYTPDISRRITSDFLYYGSALTKLTPGELQRLAAEMELPLTSTIPDAELITTMLGMKIVDTQANPFRRASDPYPAELATLTSYLSARMNRAENGMAVRKQEGAPASEPHYKTAFVREFAATIHKALDPIFSAVIRDAHPMAQRQKYQEYIPVIQHTWISDESLTALDAMTAALDSDLVNRYEEALNKPQAIPLRFRGVAREYQVQAEIALSIIGAAEKSGLLDNSNIQAALAEIDIKTHSATEGLRILREELKYEDSNLIALENARAEIPNDAQALTEEERMRAYLLMTKGWQVIPGVFPLDALRRKDPLTKSSA